MTRAQIIHNACKQLMQALTDKAFLRKAGLERVRVEMAFAPGPLEAGMAALWPVKGRIKCQDVLGAFLPALIKLGPAPADGWMKGAYDLARFDMFGQQDSLQELENSRGALFCFLCVLRFVLDAERAVVPFDPMMDFAFLSEEEASGYSGERAYAKFQSAWRNQFVYEMLRLGEECMPFTTLSHISGVHHVALTAARGLAAAGQPIDLTMASAASAGHDIGKFGCRPGERVPYLHYYYTDSWFHSLGLDEMGHVAANHSTWDLEFDNLSAESLCLIYADFRVKQGRNEKGEEYTKIFSLKESFDVILNKLDNVDAAKLERYRFVYRRLADFENYMRAKGVDVDLTGSPDPAAILPPVALRSGSQTLQGLRQMGLDHNIWVMHNLCTETLFGNLLEQARSEKDWKHLRAYLTVLDEYTKYLDFNQKDQTLEFLYGLLIHREGDIRRYAALLIGRVIADYNAGYRKEHPSEALGRGEQAALQRWDEALDRVAIPDRRLTSRLRSLQLYTFKIVVASLFESCAKADAADFFGVFMRRFDEPPADESTAFALLDAVSALPAGIADEAAQCKLMDYACEYLQSPYPSLRTAAARAMESLIATLPEGSPAALRVIDAANNMPGETVADWFSRLCVRGALGLDTTREEQVLYSEDITGDIFLDNLKTATHWVIKAENIRLLLSMVQRGDMNHVLHISTHLNNLIKVSQHVVVRLDAGRALLTMVPNLSPDQRNEIAVELLKGLEVGEYEFSKYIPECLGIFALWLPPMQLDELIQALQDYLASANERIVSVALETVQVMLAGSDQYAERFAEPEGNAEKRQERLLGILLDGMANYRREVSREAAWLLSRFFASNRPAPALKRRMLALACKKILFILDEESNPDRLDLYYRAALLGRITRFMGTDGTDEEALQSAEYGRVAFFPGTFDPFTLSHKGIVRLIRDLGYEVYLAVDEFSWSKNTQPHLVRRHIISMSVADEFHVHLFPDEIPINIANPMDMIRLRGLFGGRPVYLVAGGDVVSDASAYKAEPVPGSVHSFNHILFSRARAGARKKEEESQKCITGEIVRLQLPSDLKDISSTKIRENIDLDRDISNLIDPVVQEYIYSDNRYLREPKMKAVIGTRTITGQFVHNPPASLVSQLKKAATVPAAGALKAAAENGYVQVLRSAENSQPVGFACAQVVHGSFSNTLGSVELADEVRTMAQGGLLAILGLYSCADSVLPDAEQRVLAQLLAESLALGCTCAAFVGDAADNSSVVRALLRQGFVKRSASGKTVYLVDMRSPLVLLQNMAGTLKAPFNTSPRMLKVLADNHERLQLALTGLYPGQLVLSVANSFMLEEMTEKMTRANGVPFAPTNPRVLGPLMCVPFGKLMRGRVVPNTVTKTLHTDRVYTPTLQHSTIENFPGYTDLHGQIRTIRSFNRPVVLLDDMLHGQGRLHTILPMFRAEGVEVNSVLLGIISGHGQETISAMGVKADAVYTIPNLRYCFVESTLYPFVGGDTVRRPGHHAAGQYPSVNFILPYAMPKLPGCERRPLFELSRACLENARDMFAALEKQYRARYGRNLTISRLSEAVVLPMCPDKGECLLYDDNLSASETLNNDLDMLERQMRILG